MLSSNTSAANGAATYVEDVFSTYLYTGNGTSQSVTNGIDLSTKGGLVWVKSRVATTYNHRLQDTVRGVNSQLFSNTTGAATTGSTTITAFNTDGFSVGDQVGVNEASATYASWTFREQPKFFDVVTYTGNGSSPRAISHLLGSTPGCVIVKRTDTTGNWFVYHRSSAASGFTAAQCYMYLNLTNAVTDNSTIWGNTAPTDTTFTVGSSLNTNGATYVAYIFAHDAGGFGLTGTDNVISCGSFTTDGSGNGSATVGFESQFVLIKNSVIGSGGDNNWMIYDTMRGLTVDGKADYFLYANTADAEGNGSRIGLNATGFTCALGNSETYIYIAIRRGPMKVPTDGTKVFAPVTDVSSTTDISVSTTNQVDMIWSQPVTSVGGDNESFAFDRLRGVSTTSGTRLKLNSAAAEASPAGQGMGIAQNTGYIDNWFYNQGFTSRTIANWTFRRAPSFFDEVCYTGNGSNTTQTHNLGVAPELMIFKVRNTTDDWSVLGNFTSTSVRYGNLNTNGGFGSIDYSNLYAPFSAQPTSASFSLRALANGWNTSGNTYVAYLFATCAGVSKVGSYTGTGATQTINCGFTGGARFVMIKRTDSTGDWYIWDTARGMVSGTDPYLLLNVQSSQVNANNVYTATTGFQIVGTGAGFNASGGSYIFLAIA